MVRYPHSTANKCVVFGILSDPFPNMNIIKYDKTFPIMNHLSSDFSVRFRYSNIIANQLKFDFD